MTIPLRPGGIFLALWFALAAALPLIAAESAPGASPDEEAERLVEQLGHQKFAAREAAARRLLSIGLPAFAPLRQAAQHSDAEIRYRAADLLSELRQRDFQRRLHAFAANLDGTEEYDLPGWSEFQKVVGDSREARELFVQMQTEEPRLMQAFGEGPKPAGELLEVRCGQLLQRYGLQEQTPISLGSAAAIIFLAGREEVPLSDTAAGSIYRVCVEQSVAANVTGGAYQDILRNVLSSWIRRGPNSSSDYQKLALAMQYDLDAGLAPAVEILEQAGHPPHLRQQAMVAAAKFGNEQHVPLLERYLTDETEYGRRQLGDGADAPTQMRDVALAALIALTDQDFADYGMQHVTTAPTFIFIPWSCAFENNEARQKALEQWRASRAKAK